VTLSESDNLSARKSFERAFLVAGAYGYSNASGPGNRSRTLPENKKIRGIILIMHRFFGFMDIVSSSYPLGFPLSENFLSGLLPLDRSPRQAFLA
jgi:hypothetical protein